jgi:hypothetical protein
LWSSDFFVPVARIGKRGLDNYSLEQEVNEVTAQTTGELFLFVNDAIAPVSLVPFCLGWGAYYANNEGTAEVTVTKVADPPAAAGGQ